MCSIGVGAASGVRSIRSPRLRPAGAPNRPRASLVAVPLSRSAYFRRSQSPRPANPLALSTFEELESAEPARYTANDSRISEYRVQSTIRWADKTHDFEYSNKLDARCPMATEILTERLRLREWVAADREPFAALNADPLVMEYFLAPLSRAESDALVDRIEAKCQKFGFGFWAVEVPGVAPFAGFIGISVPSFETPFTPCVEIGWRLAREHWNRGYATEGARAALGYAFCSLHLPEIVAFTARGNARSRRVMEKLGMRHDAHGDFAHPQIPVGHPLRSHVLYRISKPELPNNHLQPTAAGEMLGRRG